MTRPTATAATEQAYRLLPDFVRNADDATDYTLLRWLAGPGTGLDTSLSFLTMVDPDTSVTGTCELVNAAACPRPYLGWLGWLVGVDTTLIADAYVRDAVGNAARTQRRGSLGAIKDAVQRTLTGSRNVRAYINVSGTDPYLITVVTVTFQTPDPIAALEAAWSEKPAGCDLELQIVEGATYSELAANFPDYDAVDTAFDTYADLSQYIP